MLHDPAPVLGLDVRRIGSLLGEHQEILGNDDRDFVRGPVRSIVTPRLSAATGLGIRRYPWPRGSLRLNDDIGSCAGDDCFDLCLLGLGHSELVKSLLEIVEKGFPL